MAIKLRLVGCDRFNFRGELYQRGKVYRVGDDKGKLMLRKVDDSGRHYFAEYRAVQKKSAAELAAEAAAAAAVAAAQLAEDEGRVEEFVERPDGSEPDKAVVVDPDAPIEPEVVDTDDDDALDEDSAGSSEEVSEDEEDEADRSDGSEVEV